MTEKQRLEFRVRNWNNLDKKGGNDGNETRLRYFYNHGNLGDSKVNFTSRIQYRDKNYSNKQDLQYQARFDFAEYLFNNDFVKTQYFQIQPAYTYEWKDGNDSQYDSQVNLDLETKFTLPLGFEFEFNVYNTSHDYGSNKYNSDLYEPSSDNFTVDVEAKIYKTVELYATEKTTLSLTFEGGYDDYSWSREDLGQKDHNFTYSIYANPFLRVDHQATEFVSLFAEVGAEYRNWAESNQCAAQDWRWQPVAAAGFNVAF